LAALNTNPDGRTTAVTDARNHGTTYAFNAVNAVTQVTDPLGHSTSVTRKGKGDRKGVESRSGAVV